MNLKNFLIGTIVAQALFIITKIFFIKFLNIESWIIIILMWLVIAVIAIAMERRQGILNYLEDFLLTIVWTVGSLILDLIITIHIVGTDVLSTLYFWLTYLVIAITLIVFHKKQHVANRS